MLTAGCNGAKQTSTAAKQAATKQAEAEAQTKIDARAELVRLSEAMPIYADAEYSDELSRRDLVQVRNQFGPQAQVYTMASEDSFPQVYHYYTTYLAQFRAFPARDTYPNERKTWRTLEVQLTDAMQDPFIPGASLNVPGKQVILQVVETDGDPKTVIRYIITPAPPAPPVVASTNTPVATIAP